MDPKICDYGFEEPEMIRLEPLGDFDLIINSTFFEKRLSRLGLELKVYLALCIMRLEAGNRAVTIERPLSEISHRAGLSLKTVRRALKKLEKSDLVKTGHRSNENGSDASNNFVVVMPNRPPEPPENVNETGLVNFTPSPSECSKNPIDMGVAQNLLSSVSTVGTVDLSTKKDSLLTLQGPYRSVGSESEDHLCGVAQRTNKDGVNTRSISDGGLSEQEAENRKLLARVKMRPNQRLVSCVWEIYDEMEVPRPSASTVGKWRNMYDGKYILQMINDLAGAGHLEKGFGYTFAVLKRNWGNYKIAKNPLDDPKSPARDGIKWGGYRWSSILGTNVEKEFWVPMKGATKGDVAAMQLHSIPQPEPTPWEAVGNFSEED